MRIWVMSVRNVYKIWVTLLHYVQKCNQTGSMCNCEVFFPLSSGGAICLIAVMILFFSTSFINLLFLFILKFC